VLIATRIYGVSNVPETCGIEKPITVFLVKLLGQLSVASFRQVSLASHTCVIVVKTFEFHHPPRVVYFGLLFQSVSFFSFYEILSHLLSTK
jgi:hypothetical protein